MLARSIICGALLKGAKKQDEERGLSPLIGRWGRRL
jgi:hypothetical protein